jgi:hypothetical protein
MTLPLEAKKFMLNERKCQQQGDEKMKMWLALMKSIIVSNDKETSNPHMPNWYSVVKNVKKEKQIIIDSNGQDYGLLNEFLE